MTGMNIAKGTFKFVPVPDLTKGIDEKSLYDYYDMTKDEISYIERLIKPMD